VKLYLSQTNSKIIMPATYGASAFLGALLTSNYFPHFFYFNTIAKGTFPLTSNLFLLLFLIIITAIKISIPTVKFKYRPIILCLIFIIGSAISLIGLEINARKLEEAVSTFEKSGWEIQNWPNIKTEEENYFPNSVQKNSIFQPLPVYKLLNPYFYTDVVYLSNLESNSFFSEDDFDFNLINRFKKLRIFAIRFTDRHNSNNCKSLLNNLMHLSDLRCLYIENCTNAFLNKFIKDAKFCLPNLKVFSLRYCSNLNPDIIHELFTWQNIQHLEIFGCDMKMLPKNSIKCAAKLVSFTFESTEESNETIWDFINDCHSLKELNVFKTKLNTENIKKLTSKSNLEKLCIPYTLLNKESICLFDKMVNLKVINLKGCSLNDSDINFIIKLKNLETADLSYNKISINLLYLLKNLKNLKNVCLESTNVSEKDKDSFKKLYPELKLHKRIVSFQSFGDLQVQLDLP